MMYNHIYQKYNLNNFMLKREAKIFFVFLHYCCFLYHANALFFEKKLSEILGSFACSCNLKSKTNVFTFIIINK